MKKSQKLNFEDYGITGFSLKEGNLYLGMEKYDDASQTYLPVSLVFSDVADMTMNDKAVSAVAPVYSDGEIIDSRIDAAKAALIIQWNDFKNKRNSTNSYVFKYGSLKIDSDK